MPGVKELLWKMNNLCDNCSHAEEGGRLLVFTILWFEFLVLAGSSPTLMVQDVNEGVIFQEWKELRVTRGSQHPEMVTAMGSPYLC